MVANFFTKPLQGSRFRKLWGVMMGLTSFCMEECIEISANGQLLSSAVPSDLIYICVYWFNGNQKIYLNKVEVVSVGASSERREGVI